MLTTVQSLCIAKHWTASILGAQELHEFLNSNYLFTKCPLPYTERYSDSQHVSLLRTLLVKPTPSLDYVQFGTAAHM